MMLILMLFKGIFLIFILLSMIHIALIAPLLFQFWIIPKIENRYRIPLRINDNDYPWAPFASWLAPPIELSSYIICSYFNLWEPPGMKTPRNKTLIFKLKEINYDIKKASKAELIMSFITIFSIVVFIVGGAWVLISK